MERTQEDLVSGVLRIAVGGTVKAVPTLKIKEIEQWATLLDTLTDDTTPSEGWTAKGVTTVASIVNGAYLDLILAYDKTGALGGRDWLVEHADPGQLAEALSQMAGNAFPLGGTTQANGAITGMVLRRLAALAPPKSTNGASRNGLATRKRSGRVSTRSS